MSAATLPSVSASRTTPRFQDLDRGNGKKDLPRIQKCPLRQAIAKAWQGRPPSIVLLSCQPYPRSEACIDKGSRSRERQHRQCQSGSRYQCSAITQMAPVFCRCFDCQKETCQKHQRCSCPNHRSLQRWQDRRYCRPFRSIKAFQQSSRRQAKSTDCHFSQHAAGGAGIRCAKKHPRRVYKAKCQQEAHRYRQIIPSCPPQPLYDLGKAMQQSPDEECPTVAMPKSADQIDDQNIGQSPFRPFAAAAQREIQAFTQKICQRNMPTLPKFRYGKGTVWCTEILRQLQTQKQTCANGNVAIAGEIQKQLQCISKCRQPSFRGV